MFNAKKIDLKKVILHLCLLVIWAGCEKKEAPLAFEQETINTENLPSCKEGLCPTIAIDKITASGRPFADTINEAVDQHLISLLIIDPDESQQVNTLDDAIQNFITNYRVYRSDFPDAIPGYEVSSKSSLSYESEHLLCIGFENYTYWGGAHGYGSTTFLNFDKETGTHLKNEELFKTNSGFEKLAEERFRKQYHIDAEKNLSETGYFFTDNKFVLPENIGFKDNQLILLYNPYEVASYAEGQLILKFDLEDVKEYLRPGL